VQHDGGDWRRPVARPLAMMSARNFTADPPALKRSAAPPPTNACCVPEARICSVLRCIPACAFGGNAGVPEPFPDSYYLLKPRGRGG
jgi:hypothetical protein